MMHKQQDRKRSYLRPWLLGLGFLLLIYLIVTLVPFGDGDSDALSLHACKTNSNSSISTSKITSGNENSLFSARRILLLNRSEHPLMQAVAEKLVERLESLPYVGKVELLGEEDSRPRGDVGHDLYMVLEMPSFEKKGLLATGRTIKAEVKLSCGVDMYDSRHGYRDDYSPPVAAVQLSSRLEHESMSRGYESANARYKQVIENIEKQIGEAATEGLAGWSGKFASPQMVPQALLPLYRPVPKDVADVIGEYGRTLSSTSGLMLYNKTVWTMETDMPLDVLNDWCDRLRERGWTVESEPLTSTRNPCYVSAERGVEVFEAFEMRDGYKPPQEGESAQLVFRYYDRMSRDEVDPVYTAMSEDPELPVQTVLCFHQKFNGAQRAALLETWLNNDHLPFAAEKFVVRQLGLAGRTEEAATHLRKLYASTLFESRKQMDEFKKLGRTIMNDEQWEPIPLTEGELVAFGAIYCPSNKTIEVELNEHALFLVGAKGAETNHNLVDAVVQPSEIPEGLYMLKTAMREGPSFDRQGSSMSSTPHTQEHPWECRSSSGFAGAHWEIEAREIATNRFTVSLRQY